MSNSRIVLIGDYDGSLTAHTTIPPALELAAKVLKVDVEPVWMHTSKLTTKEEIRSLHSYEGIWCVPGPPYANMEGAISAISLARTEEIPFLGTCAGFQHALIEYFRNVIGATNAAHAEADPAAERPLISKLSCSLVEVNGTIRLYIHGITRYQASAFFTDRANLASRHLPSKSRHNVELSVCEMR